MNVLFIITDQQRFDHVGFMGNDVVSTPNLDALAARATVFENAWVANPVCMPNRSSIMTSRMPSVHGVIFNDRSLEWGAATFVRQFRRAGWSTALIGKSHLQHGMSRNAEMPVGLDPALDDPYPGGWNRYEHQESFESGLPAWPEDFYGFSHVELSIDHGARITGHHLHWALERGGSYEELVVPLDDTSPARRRAQDWWQVYEPVYAPELHSTSFVAERTIDFIERSAAAGEPWLAWASFPDPHHPMTPPGEWYDLYDPAEMELPASIDDPMEHSFSYLRGLQRRTAAEQPRWVSPFGVGGVVEGDRAAQRALFGEILAATYGTITFIDHSVGRILAAVEAAGQTDDTIVVFTSDHGDQMGDHGLVLKGWLPYRGTQQVPLAIADPAREDSAGTRTASLASSLDLGQTLMEMCGVELHDGMQGVSLVPLLDDPTAAVRDYVLIEDDARRAFASAAGVPLRTRSLVMNDGLRYTRNSDGDVMEFDLGEDPDELVELTHDHPELAARGDFALAGALIDATDDARGAPTSASR